MSLTRTYTCKYCGHEHEQEGPGPLRTCCGGCISRRRKEHVRGPGRLRNLVLDAARKRQTREYERQARRPKLVCGCGRDYLTVELEDHTCPNPVIR